MVKAGRGWSILMMADDVFSHETTNRYRYHYHYSPSITLNGKTEAMSLHATTYRSSSQMWYHFHLPHSFSPPLSGNVFFLPKESSIACWVCLLIWIACALRSQQYSHQKNLSDIYHRHLKEMSKFQDSTSETRKGSDRNVLPHWVMQRNCTQW